MQLHSTLWGRASERTHTAADKGIHVEREDGGGRGGVRRQETSTHFRPAVFLSLCLFSFLIYAWIKLYVHFLIGYHLWIVTFYVFSYIGKLFLKEDFKMKKKKKNSF